MSNSVKKAYLELSEDDGVSHKFYEVTVDGKEVAIRYGRIGTEGRTSLKTCATPEKARAEAEKKVKEKLQKGYEHAVKGVRQKRPTTRRQITSKNSTAKQAPILWKFKTGARAFGIFIDEMHCWIGNQDGSVFALDHNAQVLNQYRLPDGVKCIVSDGSWIYVGCDDGNVYDLTGKLPRAAYEISDNIDIYWTDIYDALLGVSDADGTVMIADHENENLWMKKSKGDAGWMVRCDDDGYVYHGHSKGITAYYGLENPVVRWEYNTKSNVLFGWQEKTSVYAGTGSGKVYALSKAGKLENIYDCDAAVYSCAASEHGKYVFAGDNYSSVYCFSKSGERLWKLATGCGSAYSMQYYDNRVYIVTTDGSLACIDASEEAISSAQAGIVPGVKDIKAPKPVAVSQSTDLEIVSSPDQGAVVVQCIREGGKLRVRVVTGGYNQDWNVQFPRNIREENAFYAVDEIRESSRGGFYRVYGNIQKLVRESV